MDTTFHRILKKEGLPMKNVTALALCCVLILSSFSTAFANNTSGYFPYIETLDVSSIVRNII